MGGFDLRTVEGLKDALQIARTTHRNLAWESNLKATLEKVRASSEEDRASPAFQEWLWEDNHISGVGMGRISLDSALSDEKFRTWVAHLPARIIPGEGPDRVEALTAIYDEFQAKLKRHSSRTPHLKIFRVLAALYPLDFTTLADRDSLQRLLRFLFGSGKGGSVAGHMRIRQRLTEALGDIDATDAGAVAEHLTLPWYLYALVRDPDPEPIVDVSTPGEEKLLPLPANRRRKGLTAIKGLFPEMLSTLEFVREGVTKDELIDYLRANSPESKDVSLRTAINVLRSEFGVIRREGDTYVLTARGEGVLESGAPDEMRDWLITRILGIDHLLVDLTLNGSCEVGHLEAVLMAANPGWTTTFAPRSMLNWLRSLDVIDRNDAGQFSLTERGQEWAQLVDWRPEPLEPEPVPEPEPEPELAIEIRLPSLGQIREAVQQKGVFASDLITSLHMGLWAHRRRHFAILTGLSGAGKTLLATEYAHCIVGAESGAEQRVEVIPVQPGWYDPTPLFGYVHPLVKDSYESTVFLELLLRASKQPALPHVAVLDEMNLSHPEQYLAPLLSTMETGKPLVVHTKGEHYDGIPSRIGYPANLVIIGTVNMDETTLGLSDKVLDRAFVLEFWDIQISDWPSWGATGLSADEEMTLRTILEDLLKALRPARLHFGWRTIGEITGFLRRREAHAGGLTFLEATDHVVSAKIIPKLRGEDAPRFRKALEDCSEALKEHNLPKSRQRVAELIDDLITTGSARYWR